VSGIDIRLMRLVHGKDLPLPAYQSEHAAGFDLLAAVPSADPITIAPGARALVPTGLAMALPEGYEAQVRPRSGLAARDGLTILNSPGTIDADYRGEIQVLLVNLGSEGCCFPRHADCTVGYRATCTRSYCRSCVSRQNLTRKRRIRLDWRLKPPESLK